MKQTFIIIQKTCESTKPNNFCSQQNNIKHHISFLEDGASGEQKGDIEKIIVKNLFKNLIILHEIDESSKNKLL